VKKELQETKTSAIAEYSATEAALSELRERLKDARYDVATTIGMDTAKKDRRELVTLRTSLETKRKEIKAPALERCRLIDDAAKRITSELLKLEQPIDAQIKAEEDRKAAIKAEKERIEKERVDGIQARITRIRNLPLGAVGKDAMSLEIYIAQIEAAQIGVEFAEFAEEATAAKVEVVATLKDTVKTVQEQEQEAARIKAEQEAEAARLEELRIEQEKAVVAERDRLAAEKAEQDRLNTIEQEKIAAERAELAKLREAEAARQKEADDKARTEREEADRIAADERARQQAIIDDEKAELQKKQEEAARIEREKAEAEAEAAERKRIEDEKQRADYEAKMTAATADYMTTLQSILNACNDSTLSAPAALQLVAELAKRGMKGAK